MWHKKLIAYIFSKLIVFKIYIRETIINPIKERITLIKRKIGNKHSTDIFQKQLFDIADIAIDKNAIKIEHNKKEFSFLLKHIYEFQYNNIENSKDIEVYKIGENQETNRFIISGKLKMEKIQFFN